MNTPLHFLMTLFFLVISGASYAEVEQKSAVPAAQPPANSPATAPSPSGEVSLEKALEEGLSFRDPFKRPDSAIVKSVVAASELERFPTEQYKLVGVITGASRLRAIVQDPEGKTHFVAERMRIGTRRGVIRQIRADAVVVREKVVNVLGKEEASDSEIRLPDEDRKVGGSSG